MFILVFGRDILGARFIEGLGYILVGCQLCREKNFYIYFAALNCYV